jgi:putative transposase
MAELFKGKYRVPSARCCKWDYRSQGAYFITICTAGRRNYFGEIISGSMQLSDAGSIVQNNWSKIPEHFHYVSLDSFIVMPNHFHGILIISADEGLIRNRNEFYAIENQENNIDKKKSNKAEKSTYSDISPKAGSISTIIRSFKSSCTRDISNMDPKIFFKWQPRFHDHIIRNHHSFIKIRNYILNNPKKWNDDLFYQ